MDALNRETLRTLADGSQTLLACTPDGHVDTYTDLPEPSTTAATTRGA
jgi:hypothetical protein